MFGWQRRRAQLLEEFEAHIELEANENVARGMTPEQAWHAARKKFGNPLVAAENARSVWGGVWLERLAQDVRYAVRSLRSVPAYTLTLIGTLALGLGCVATMLAVVDSVLLRPIPLTHPEQLVRLWGAGGSEGFHASDFALSYPAIDELRRSNRSFSDVADYNLMVRPVMAQDGTRITVVVDSSLNLLRLLGFSARMGRLFTPADSGVPVAVVSDGFWRERLHADPHAIGTTVHLFGKPRTIIGVLPAGVQFPQNAGTEYLFVPFEVNAKGEDEFGLDAADTIARLKPGVTQAQALAEAQSLFKNMAKTPAEARRRLILRSYQDTVTGDLRRPLWTLLAGVGALLLIACANAANLQIGRATNRIGEITIRSALGASFGRILQQLITESLLVSFTAAALAGTIAFFAIRLLKHAYGSDYTRFDEISLHPIVLGATVVLAALVGLLATVAPAVRLRKQVLRPSGARGSSRSSRLPGVLVALQIAVTCVLLVVSGLLTRTLHSLAEVKLGFDPHDVSTLVLMPADQSQSPQLSRDLEARLLERFGTLPGVEGVTTQSSVPFSNYNIDLNGGTDVEGHVYRQGETAHYSLVSTSFVRVSGIHLLQGRTFGRADESSPDIVVLVNQAFLKTFVSDRNPLGTVVRFHREPGETDADQPVAGDMTIVGVVENELQGGALDSPYEPMVYLDSAQFPKNSMLNQVFNMSAQYAIRSALPMAALDSELRAVIKQDAPSMVEMSLGPMSQGIADSLGQRRLALRLVTGFSSVALLLSAAGIYGVLAYSVALRRREIGIRMALGSSRSETAGLVLRQAVLMVAFGLVPGIAGAWMSGHAIRSFLYGVRALDAPTVVLVAVLLLTVAVLAAALPILRAVQVDPAETLRAE
jgi:predicted permease